MSIWDIGLITWEIHLTSRLLREDELAVFSAQCQRLGCRPLLIELARGERQQQAMASVRFSGEYQNAEIARTRAAVLCDRFDEVGFAIERIKIETDLDSYWKGDPVYFEWHGKLPVQSLPGLLSVCELHGAHLSRNALKSDTDMRFVTLRGCDTSNDGKERFRRNVQSLCEVLDAGGWHCVTQHAETCVYDSREALDDGWLEIKNDHRT